MPALLNLKVAGVPFVTSRAAGVKANSFADTSMVFAAGEAVAVFDDEALAFVVADDAAADLVGEDDV